MRTAQRRNYSQTCDSGTPAFPSLRLQVQHEWFLNCCPYETYTSCPLSNRLKNQLLSRKVKYTICKILRFTTRAVKALSLSLCQPESDPPRFKCTKAAELYPAPIKCDNLCIEILRCVKEGCHHLRHL